MYNSFEFSYDYISELLTQHYRYVYKNNDIECQVYSVSYMKKGIGWDDSDEYYTHYKLKAYLSTKVKSVAFGKTVESKDCLIVEEKEIVEALTEIFNRMLDAEGNGFKVFWITGGEDKLAVTIQKENVLKKA